MLLGMLQFVPFLYFWSIISSSVTFTYLFSFYHIDLAWKLQKSYDHAINLGSMFKIVLAQGCVFIVA